MKYSGFRVYAFAHFFLIANFLTPAAPGQTQVSRLLGDNLAANSSIRQVVCVATSPIAAAWVIARQRWRDSEPRTDDLLQALNLQAGQVVVDIGAGDGELTRRFATIVGEQGKAIGVEIDPEKVRKMTAEARRRGLTNYEARLVPADDPMLSPGSTDVVFLRDTYHHIEDRVAYFAKIKAALKPGGRLMIVDFPKRQSHHECGIAKDQVMAELREAGYRLVKEHDSLQSRQYILEFVPISKSAGTDNDL